MLRSHPPGEAVATGRPKFGVELFVLVFFRHSSFCFLLFAFSSFSALSLSLLSFLPLFSFSLSFSFVCPPPFHVSNMSSEHYGMHYVWPWKTKSHVRTTHGSYSPPGIVGDWKCISFNIADRSQLASCRVYSNETFCDFDYMCHPKNATHDDITFLYHKKNHSPLPARRARRLVSTMRASTWKLRRQKTHISVSAWPAKSLVVDTGRSLQYCRWLQPRVPLKALKKSSECRTGAVQARTTEPIKCTASHDTLWIKEMLSPLSRIRPRGTSAILTFTETMS